MRIDLQEQLEEELANPLLRLVDLNESPDEAVARIDDHRVAAEKALQELRVFFGRETRTRAKIKELTADLEALIEESAREKDALKSVKSERAECAQKLVALYDYLKEISQIQDVCRAEYKTASVIYYEWIEYLDSHIIREKIHKAQLDYGEDWSI